MPDQAHEILEQLRYGIPPADHVRWLTVGRDEQLAKLEASLRGTASGPRALLIKANYGGGKSHLLQVIRRTALDAGYAVSLVVVDAQGGVRFNRMDTVLGAVSQRLEVPGASRIGVGSLFDAFSALPECDQAYETLMRNAREGMQPLRDAISSGGRWYGSKVLRSPAVYVALRAWTVSPTRAVRRLVEDWLSSPFNYRGQCRLLYQTLVRGIWTKIWADALKERDYYDRGVFSFHPDNYRQAWDALADFDLLARASGLRGLVLIFDEFEDVIQNLNRRDLQEQAVQNLLRFFDNPCYPGKSYFAVTPDFFARTFCELIQRRAYDLDFHRLSELPSLAIDQLSANHVFDLGVRIRSLHATAYAWDAEGTLPDPDLEQIVRCVWRVNSPERVRRAIQTIVRTLDEKLDGSA